MKFLASILWIAAAVLFTFAIHEAAHGLAGAGFGYDMIVRLNGAEPVGGSIPSAFEPDAITAAGPAITLLQGFAAAWLAAVWRPAFTLALSAFLMRVLAAAASFRNPNDEARLGLSWDIGYWTLHILVIGVLSIAVLMAARRARPGWRRFATTTVMTVMAFAVVVFTDRLSSSVLFRAL